MTGVVESTVGSASVSVLSMIAYLLYKRWTIKTKVIGLLVPFGKTNAEINMNNKDKVLYFDMDGAISTQRLVEIAPNKRRLDLYPKALEKLNSLKKNYVNYKIFVLSSDPDLLSFLHLKKKALCFIPSKKFMVDNAEKINNANTDKMCLQYQIDIKNNHLFTFESFDGLSRLLNNAFEKWKSVN